MESGWSVFSDLHGDVLLTVTSATATYRLLPLVILNPEKPVPPQHSEKFQKCFSPGVIEINPITKGVSVNEENLRNETMSREVFRHKEFEGCVELKRVRDFFICESWRPSLLEDTHTIRPQSMSSRKALTLQKNSFRNRSKS